jgi:hypothetical protein
MRGGRCARLLGLSRGSLRGPESLQSSFLAPLSLPFPCHRCLLLAPSLPGRSSLLLSPSLSFFFFILLLFAALRGHRFRLLLFGGDRRRSSLGGVLLLSWCRLRFSCRGFGGLRERRSSILLVTLLVLLDLALLTLTLAWGVFEWRH